MSGNHNGEVYQVERILDDRVDEVNGMEYLIRWCGYDSTSDTWEPDDNVTVELKEEYHQSPSRAHKDFASNGSQETQSKDHASSTLSSISSMISTHQSNKRKSSNNTSSISSSLVIVNNNINHNGGHPNKMARPTVTAPIKMEEPKIAKQLNESVVRSSSQLSSSVIDSANRSNTSTQGPPTGVATTATRVSIPIDGVANKGSTTTIPLEPNQCLPLFDDSDLCDASRWDRRIIELTALITSFNMFIASSINEFDKIRLMTHIIRLTHLLTNNSSSLSLSSTMTIWSKRVQLFDKLITCPILIGNELIQSEWFLSIIENWLSLLIKSLTSLTQTHSTTSEQHQPNNNNTEGSGMSGSGGSGSATSIIIMIISNVLGFLNWLPLPYPLRSPSLSCIKLNHDINTLQQLPNNDNNNNNNNNNTNRSKDSHRMTLLITRSKGNHYLFFSLHLRLQFHT
jgi:hypothetical protein